MKIYFAGSIRSSHEDKNWYVQILKSLRRYGEVFTEDLRQPTGASLGEKLKNADVYERNMAWLEASDRLVAEVTTPSFEVGYEIALAEQWGKPILCLYRRGNSPPLSPIIAGNDKLMIRQYESKIDMERSVRYFFGH